VNRVLDGIAGVHIGATWQIQLIDIAAAVSGSVTGGGDAASVQITSTFLVKILYLFIYKFAKIKYSIHPLEIACNV